jgi:regulator of sigma E protease
MLYTIFYFLLALVLLIVIHEYGHFLVARLCGVKVLRFSFGFGKVITRYKGKKGTEYVWSLFPLGGYVKMLDESEGDVAENERHLAFNNQSLWKRVAIVLAGPVFNFIFAFIALWLMWVIGFKSLAPIIDEVKPNSIASIAGLTSEQEIIRLNNTPIRSWRDFQYALLPLLGGDEPVTFTTQSLADKTKHDVTISISQLDISGKQPDVLKSLGIVPFVPKVPPVVGEVVADSPAYKAGLEVGDKVSAIDGKTIVDWLEVVSIVREIPNKSIQISLLRDNRPISKTVIVGEVEQNGSVTGFLGVKSAVVNWPKEWVRTQRKGPVDAALKAADQTIGLTGATLTLMGRLVIGKLPIQSLSGPVGIAKGAGDSARGGLSYYLSFLAMVSISLGVLNLLPIPILDGGHLLYYLIEAIRRKPLSEETQTAGMYVGMFILMSLMIIALGNDMVRLAG